MGGSFSSMGASSRRLAHEGHQHELSWPAAAPASPLPPSKAPGRPLGSQDAGLGPEAGTLEVAAGAQQPLRLHCPKAPRRPSHRSPALLTSL